MSATLLETAQTLPPNAPLSPKQGPTGGERPSFDGTLRSVEASLERLGLEQLDLVYIHDAMRVPMEDVMSKNGALGALRRLQNEGIVRFIGSASMTHRPTRPTSRRGNLTRRLSPMRGVC